MIGGFQLLLLINGHKPFLNRIKLLLQVVIFGLQLLKLISASLTIPS